MLYRLLCILLFLTWLAAAADKDPWGAPIPVQPWMGQGWPLRPRVVADYETGFAWRLPYELLPRDQAQASYRRLRNKMVFAPSGTVADGRPSVRIQHELEWEDVVAAQLLTESVGVAAVDLAAAGDRLVGAKLTWRPYDYHASTQQRPFAHADWAPPAISALIGSADGIAALAITRPGRLGVAILRGEFSARVDLLDQVEVMAEDERARLRTWAEAQGEAKAAINKDRKVVRRQTGGTPWSEALEFETRHYHITGNSTPARLAAHAADLEALHTAYREFFGTDDRSPLKFEVLITNTWEELSELSAACKNPLEVPIGTVLGGFFIPLQQSLWLYEASGQLGGPSMAIAHVMSHECSHQFLHMACNGSDHVPTWINEGVAVHFENGTLVNGRYRHRPPVERIKRLAELYKKRKTTLQPMNIYLDHHGGIGADLYGEVYAMVHFWAFGAPGGRERFRKYWQALRTGEDGLVAFERIFTADLAKAAGSRQAGLDRWRDQLAAYVQRELTKLK